MLSNRSDDFVNNSAGALPPSIPENIRMAGNGGPLAGYLIHSHKIQWVSGCLCKIFFPSPTLSQKIVIIKIGLSQKFPASVAGCSVRVDRAMKMMANGY